MRPVKILVVREEDSFSSELRQAGLDVETLPLIETVPEPDLSVLTAELARLDSYDGIFFTSPHAVQTVLGADEGKLRGYGGKIYVVGERAKCALAQAGINTAGDASDSADDMLRSIPQEELKGKRFLYFCGDRSLRKIPDRLEGIAEVKEVVVYSTVDIEPPDEAVRSVRESVASGEINWVCFFSPSASEAFKRTIHVTQNGRMKAAAIGPTTADRARELGFQVEFISPAPSPSAFAEGLISKINAN